MGRKMPTMINLERVGCFQQRICNLKTAKPHSQLTWNISWASHQPAISQFVVPISLILFRVSWIGPQKPKKQPSLTNKHFPRKGQIWGMLYNYLWHSEMVNMEPFQVKSHVLYNIELELIFCMFFGPCYCIVICFALFAGQWSLLGSCVFLRVGCTVWRLKWHEVTV